MLDSIVPTSLASVPVPLPTVPNEQVFTEEQWQILLSVCEVFVPSITPSRSEVEESAFTAAETEIKSVLTDSASSSTSHELVRAYLAESVHDNAEFKEALRRRFLTLVPKSRVKGLAFILSALTYTAGSYILTGSTTSLAQQPLTTRTEVICKWSNSYLPLLRGLFASFEALTKSTWLPLCKNLHQIIDFPSIPKHIERNPGFAYDFLDFTTQPADTSASSITEIAADIVIVGSGCGAGVIAWHLASSLSPLSPNPPRILVLEKGYHFPSSHFPMEQPSAGTHLFETGGGLISDDNSIAVLAGATWGGGGTVNWSASLQPHHFVREEWATTHNLPFVLGRGFQACLDQVCDMMGACRTTDEAKKSQIPHSFANRTVLEGARQLGLAAEVVPQNTQGQAHMCGRCGNGCASATKQGPANFWLPEAAKNSEGVEFVQGCTVEKIVWTELQSSSSSRTGNKKPLGVKAKWTSPDRGTTRNLFIKAPQIVVCAGTIHSPLLLLRSGLTNRNIGSNLHLHPTVCVGSIYAERVEPWEGPILTSAVTTLEDLDGQGHGPKIEVMVGTPDYMAVWQPWRPKQTLAALKKSETEISTLSSALAFKLQLAKFAHSFGMISLQRDRDSGSVYIDPDDPDRLRPRVAYTISDRDRAGLLAGAALAAKIAYRMGAKEIDVFAADIEPFVRASAKASREAGREGSHRDGEEDEEEGEREDDLTFSSWLTRLQSPSGSKALSRTILGSAHQMGTCRMSARKEDGVVDARGRVWDIDSPAGGSSVSPTSPSSKSCEKDHGEEEKKRKKENDTTTDANTIPGLYVADASIFPSASGVNPMVTTMGLALWIAKGIVRDYKTMHLH